MGAPSPADRGYGGYVETWYSEIRDLNSVNWDFGRAFASSEMMWAHENGYFDQLGHGKAGRMQLTVP